ncbi:hypothetical protein [Kitasatospora sp. NPDC057223]
MDTQWGRITRATVNPAHRPVIPGGSRSQAMPSTSDGSNRSRTR